MLEILSAYLLGTMLVWSPAKNHAYLNEGEDFTIHRYTQIADDLAVVASEEEPLDELVEGDYDVARAHTALLMLAIASYESGGFRNDIDRLAKRGDGGRSHCLMQVMVRSHDEAEEVKTRKGCFRLGLARIRESFDACQSSSIENRLAGYAAGHCDSQAGIAASKVRYGRMEEWWKSAPFYGMIGGK